MRAFFIEHVDAIITTIIGLWMTVYAWRHRKQLWASPKKIVRALPILALLVLLFGLLRFAFDSLPTMYVWKRVYSEDRQASAEFPCAVATSTTTIPTLGTPYKQLTIKCDVPPRGLNLRLSYNEIPPEYAGLTIEQRLNSFQDSAKQTGYTITSCIPEVNRDAFCYRIVMNNGSAQILMRLAITPKAVYRVMATYALGSHDDDAVATRFVDSFRLQ